MIAEIDEEAGREAESRMNHLGPVLFVRTDVRDEESVKKVSRGPSESSDASMLLSTMQGSLIRNRGGLRP